MKLTDCDFLKNTFPNVWNMTSREFHADTNARADLIAAHLKDCTTMKFFEEAIRFNRHLIKGKIILVLNAGIDICFSLFAIKYGAAHVYAVDNSEAIEYLNAILEPNNMSGKITAIKGRIQDIELPVEKVDMILSNWIGYALLIENKIQSVLYARDKWLTQTGVILPDCADLLVTGVQNSKNKNQRINWWRDVQGFNMRAIRKTVAIEPTFQSVDPNEVLTMPVKVWSINLNKLTHKELCFETKFYFEIIRGGCLEGLLAYFDVHFSKSHFAFRFSTAPWQPYTKWLQTVLYFDEPVSVNNKERYYFRIMMRNGYLRDQTFATHTHVEFYSGPKSNLSLVLNKDWLCKWLYADHKNGVANTKNSSSESDEKSPTKIKNKSLTKSPVDENKNSIVKMIKPKQEGTKAIQSTEHDWSHKTMQKELDSTLKPKPKKLKTLPDTVSTDILPFPQSAAVARRQSKQENMRKDIPNFACVKKTIEKHILCSIKKNKDKQVELACKTTEENAQSKQATATSVNDHQSQAEISVTKQKLELKVLKNLNSNDNSKNTRKSKVKKIIETLNDTQAVAVNSSSIDAKPTDVNKSHKLSKPKQKRKHLKQIN